MKLLTAEQLAHAIQCPHKRATRWVEPLNDAMRRFRISTIVRAAHFLGQLGHESLSLSRLEDPLSFSHDRLLEEFGDRISLTEVTAFVHQPVQLANRVYANRNGNGNEASGDGYLFRRRGPLQHGGRHTYRQLGQLINQPLEEQPALLIEPAIGAMAAAAHWHANNLNVYADQRDVLSISRALSFGSPRWRALPRGMAERAGRTRKALEALNTL